MLSAENEDIPYMKFAVVRISIHQGVIDVWAWYFTGAKRYAH